MVVIFSLSDPSTDICYGLFGFCFKIVTLTVSEIKAHKNKTLGPIRAGPGPIARDFYHICSEKKILFLELHALAGFLTFTA